MQRPFEPPLGVRQFNSQGQNVSFVCPPLAFCLIAHRLKLRHSVAELAPHLRLRLAAARLQPIDTS